MATSLAADGMLELSTLKVYLLCREDFEEAVSQGTTGPKLFAICGMLRLNLRADVEANEGYNSLIRITTERAKHIGLPLLAARCNTKAALGIASRGAASKWSAIRPAAEAALLDVVDHCFAGEVVMDDATRWLTPNSTATLPTKKELQRSAIRFHPHLRPSARLLFSAHNNLLLHRAQKHVNIRWGFAFAPDLLTTPVYVSPEKNYSLAMCVECHVIQSNETSILRVRRPFSFCSSADLMATFYREDLAAVNASLFQVELSWQVSPEHGLHAVVSGDAPLFQLENKHLTVPTSHQPHQSSGESRQDAGTDVEQRAGGVRHPDQPSGPARDPSAEEAFGLLHGLGLSADEIDDWLEDIQAASLQSEADGYTQAWMATDKADADEEAAVRRQAALATAMDEQRTKSGTKRKRGGASSSHDSTPEDISYPGDGVDVECVQEEILQDNLDEVAARETDHVQDDFAQDICQSGFESVAHHWHTQAKLGSKILADRSVALASVPLGGGYPLQMSLMATSDPDSSSGQPQAVFFVHWRDVVIKEGRVVRIDVQGRAIYPAGTPAKTYADATVVHPAIGVCVARARGVLRADIPSDILRLRRMWEACASGPVECLPSCVGCKADCQGLGVENDWRTCPLCLQTWHRVCAGRAVPFCRVLFGDAIHTRDIPNIFLAFLCEVCAEWTAACGRVGEVPYRLWMCRGGAPSPECSV